MFTALRQAVRWQLVARNVAESVEAPKPTSKRIEALEPEQAHAILQAVAGTGLEIPVVLALGTGLRRGEVLGLRWDDVDLDTGHARIAQTLQTDGSFGTPKTHRSNRAIAMPAPVVTALRAHRKTQNERRLICGHGWYNLDLVIDRGDGSPMPPWSLSHDFTAVAKSLGLDLSFHGLRHAYATLALSAGVDMKTTQTILGHASFGVTADLYSHVSERADTVAAGKVGALLFPLADGREL